MASSKSSLALYCVLLSLTALAVTVRPALLADERTQIETVEDVLLDSYYFSSETGKTADGMDDVIDLAKDCSRISLLLNATVGEFTRSNTRLAALDADHKLIPFGGDEGSSVVSDLKLFVHFQDAALVKLFARHQLLCMVRIDVCMNRFGVAVVNLYDEVDTFASYVMRVIPTDKKSAVEELFDSLNKTLAQAQSNFTCDPAFTSVLRTTVTGV